MIIIRPLPLLLLTGRHLPSWFRSIAPKTALEVHEESWNAYPYTRTKFSVPYVEKFSLEIETKFEADNGCQVSGGCFSVVLGSVLERKLLLTYLEESLSENHCRM